MTSIANIFLILVAVLAISSFPSHGQNRITGKKDSYSLIVRKIISDRDSINHLYSFSQGNEREKHLLRTEEYLIRTYYTKLLPEWMGTKWEFYGETQIPGDSSIACGHFVVTTLQHLGVNPDRAYEMATNFSAYMVNSLCDSSYKVYKSEDLIRIVEQKPDDVWVVGLHNHSGLLINYKGKLHFVHSSYSYPTAVVNELADESHTFQHSTIYVAGNLFRNNSLTEKWIRSELVKYVKKY
jgi:hypothetical protein